MKDDIIKGFMTSNELAGEMFGIGLFLGFSAVLLYFIFVSTTTIGKITSIKQVVILVHTAVTLGLLVAFTFLNKMYTDNPASPAIRELFFDNIPPECIELATGAQAKREVFCTVEISRDFVIRDGAFMPLDEGEEQSDVAAPGK